MGRGGKRRRRGRGRNIDGLSTRSELSPEGKCTRRLSTRASNSTRGVGKEKRDVFWYFDKICTKRPTREKSFVMSSPIDPRTKGRPRSNATVR